MQITGGAPERFRLKLKAADEANRLCHPGRVFHHLLTGARAGGKNAHHAAVAIDQTAEDETARRTRNQHIAIERRGEIRGGDARAPDFIARAVIACSGIDEDSDEFGRGLGRDDNPAAAWGFRPIRPQYRGDRKIDAIGKPNQIGGGDIERGCDAIEPIHRNGARAGFKTTDGLRGGGRIAAARDIFQCQITRATHFADGSDHLGSFPA